MSPYKSKKQIEYMHAYLPKIAKKWDKRYGEGIKGKSKKKVSKKK